MPIASGMLKEALEVFGPCLCQAYGQAQAPQLITFRSTADLLDAMREGKAGHVASWQACHAEHARGDHGRQAQHPGNRRPSRMLQRVMLDLMVVDFATRIADRRQVIMASIKRIDHVAITVRGVAQPSSTSSYSTPFTYVPK